MTTDCPYDSFIPSTPIQRRRRITLAELVRPTPGYEWAAILNDSYLTKDGADIFVSGFDDLLNTLDGSEAVSFLDEIRKLGCLTEGVRNIPQAIVICMSKAGIEPFFVRSIGSLEPQKITGQQMTENISNLVGAAAGEFELCDSGSTWYLRLRDDDPLAFLYADAALLDEMKGKASRHVLRLPESFMYAY